MDVLARLTASTAEDPFGPGDPLEVARLIRRSLAAAGRKAIDVTRLIVVADAPVPVDALGRFARRALGPHGASVALEPISVAGDRSHEERIGIGLDARPVAGGLSVILVMGPDDVVSALCVAAAGTVGRSGAGRA
jgi:hypothetical protein